MFTVITLFCDPQEQMEQMMAQQMLIRGAIRRSMKSTPRYYYELIKQCL